VVSILLLFLISWPALAVAQTADALGRVKNIYIGASDTGPHAQDIRKFLAEALEKDHSIAVVADPTRADAILNTTSAIWVKSYISVNPRSPGTRFPVYGGFLSAQLDTKDGDALWSYLVTPGTSATSNIPQNLATQLASKLLSVLHDAASSSPNRPSQTASRIVRIAGATFPAPLYRAWIDSFQQRHPDVHIIYNSIGTEAGLQLLHDNKITLAASDVPLSDAYMTQMPVKLLQFATVIGAVVPVYHLPYAAQDLNFTPEILADIYLGKIRRWNDPAIRAINHGVTLPDADIFVVHRADGSGTTFVFTDFLSKTVPAWKAAPGSGTTINWPTGHPAPGNDGVASLVEKTPNSVGYIELSYAIQRQLSYGTVRNAAGNFIQANLITLAAAAGTSGDIHTPITNASGKDAYPIASYTWLLVPQTFPDPAIKSAVTDFLDWILTSGQKECSALAYNPLPKEVLTREQEMLAKFKTK
jgi:phosphate ABC transporter phosphate-binding protein